jgi:hypothetical protein
MSTMKQRPLSQRQGLNCTLSYHHGIRYSYACRVEGITWGVRPVMDEAAGRDRRTAYPHRVAPLPFQIVVILNGYFEFTDFRDFMMAYAGFTYDSQLSDHGTDRAMTVTIPKRRFMRKGILLTGISFGDHVGSMVWKIPYVFEPTSNPLEKNSAARLSTYSFGTAAGLAPETSYFYPFGKQLQGEQMGSDYAEPTAPEPDPQVDPPSAPAELPPIVPPTPPPASGAQGDTNNVPRNTPAGPSEKTIPEQVFVHIDGAGGGVSFESTLYSMDPPQPIKQNGNIVGYSYRSGKHDKTPTYDVFTSGNVADHASGQRVGNLV